MGYKKVKLSHISLQALEKYHTYDYDIYCKNPDGIFNIFIKQGDKFDREHEMLITQKHVQELYIKYKDHQLYEKDIQKYIKYLIKDQRAPIDKKVSLLQELTADVMDDLFNSELNIKKVEQVQEIVNDTVKFLLREPHVIKEMLKITKYDYYTYTHCVNVSTYAIGFAKSLHVDTKDLLTIGMAALMHDIGKRKISSEIINKDGRLTPEEFEEIKKHPLYGVEILKELNQDDPLLLILIEQHHEKVNGSGYPHGLKNEEIHLYSKILCIVDIFDALTTKRSYKAALRTFEAFNIMYNHMRNELDIELLQKFMKFMNQ